jgi:hypothetical protein
MVSSQSSVAIGQQPVVSRGRKEGRKEATATSPGSSRKEGRKEERKEGSHNNTVRFFKEGRKEGRKEGSAYQAEGRDRP